MMALCTSQIYYSCVVKGCKRELGVLQGVHFLASFRIESSVHLLLVCICNFKDMILYAHQQNEMLCYKLLNFKHTYTDL